jgi:hypothetical protein
MRSRIRRLELRLVQAILDTLRAEDHYVPLNAWTTNYLQRCRLNGYVPLPDTLRQMLLMPKFGP